MDPSMHHDHGMSAAMDTTTAMMSHHDHHNHHHANMSSMMNGTTNSTMMGGSGMGGMAGMGGMGGGSGDHSGHDMSGMQGMNGMMMDMGMKMYFHLGVKEYVLLEACHTKSDRDMVIACVVIFLLAVLYEGLKFVREVMLQRSFQDQSSNYYHDNKAMTPGNSQEQMVVRGPQRSVSSQILSCSHVIQTFLHILQIFLSYCLMLVFMTYNVWLCVAVVLGAGVGYFVFGWKRAMVVDANEHCH